MNYKANKIFKKIYSHNKVLVWNGWTCWKNNRIVQPDMGTTPYDSQGTYRMWTFIFARLPVTMYFYRSTVNYFPYRVKTFIILKVSLVIPKKLYINENRETFIENVEKNWHPNI